jgi:pimeloyl-ACP methyl ester carboxylesterase
VRASLTSRRLPVIAHLVIALAAAIAIAGCTPGHNAATTSSTATPGPGVSGSAPAGAGIAFSNCTGQFQTAIGTAQARTMSFGCAKVPVPLDYATPAAGSIDLFVVKAHLMDQQASARLGSLVVNPGGPGLSGVNFVAGLLGQLDPQLLERFDVVGFDPRGTGLSEPISCIADRLKDADAAADPDMRTVAGRARAKQLATQINAGCLTKYRGSLAQYSSLATARDLDRVRAALGDSTLNYLGYSYGTRLGAVYAQLFPGRVRAMVLDGAVDPVTAPAAALERQAQSFEKSFDQFAAFCAVNPACGPLPHARARVSSLLAAADRHPIASSATGETRRASGGIVLAAVAAALYDPTAWASLAVALIRAGRGDAAQLFSLVDRYDGRDPATGHFDTVADAGLVIGCNDAPGKASDSAVAALATAWTRKYPLFGNNAAALLYTCTGWPDSGQPLPTTRPAGTPPILVVGTVGDPATPYASAGLLARTLGSGEVLTWLGNGHTAYPKTRCVRTKVDAYLVTPDAPAAGTCPATS